MNKAVELLFNDCSKNISDLKARQWIATNFGVLAIVAIAVFARHEERFRLGATALRCFIAVWNSWVTYS
ncbi:MAG TPA: hypothetical protein VGV15_19115 [Terriglobales bacterium]|nr:hypothetical protein [Terriglobales bacterium]